MKLRPVQLVCLALLLATLRLADPAALAPDDFALRAGVLRVLLGTELAVTRDEVRPAPARRAAAPALRCGLPVQTLDAAAMAALQQRWSMLPPARHSVDVQSYTSSLRA